MYTLPLTLDVVLNQDIEHERGSLPKGSRGRIVGTVQVLFYGVPFAFGLNPAFLNIGPTFRRGHSVRLNSPLYDRTNTEMLVSKAATGVVMKAEDINAEVTVHFDHPDATFVVPRYQLDLM